MKSLNHRAKGFEQNRSRRSPRRFTARAERTAVALVRSSCAALLLGMALHCAAQQISSPETPYAAALRNYLARQDQVRSNELAAVQLASENQQRNAFEAALAEHLQALVQPAPSAPLPAPDHTPLARATLAALVLILALRVSAPRLVGCLIRRFDPWMPLPAGAKAFDLSPHALAEDPTWVGFVQAMEESVQAVAKEAAAAAASGPSADRTSFAAPGDPRRFFESALPHLTKLRTLFTELGRATEGPPPAAKVLEFLREVQAFKESAAAPVLLPVRQLTAALVGLLSQLSKQPANLTPSTLRTLAAALDLLKELCVRGVQPDLASEPPVRLLAVDDEPLTRGLVSRALQKVFGLPDLAPGGADALALAAKHSYDLIFLDVEMPGMDGYELCQKLHQTALNAATPVVFVTRHSDFQARAKSTLHGAQDLIAKPFLAFELALKALTLILHTRLAAARTAPQAAPASVATAPCLSASAPETPQAPLVPTRPAVPTVAAVDGSRRMPEPVLASRGQTDLLPQTQAPSRLTTAGAPKPTEAAKALLVQAAAQFQSFRGQLDLLGHSAQPEELNALLAKFYPTIASFCSEAYCANLNAAFRLGSALEAMLKKLLEKPKLRPPSTLESVALALDVLVELAQNKQDLDLDQAPARLLVVDDDPLARRMMGEALQMAFSRPESAESGEAALAQARTKAFDLIYLDVFMPGLDGFAACAEIRRTALNGRTPVMFVTGQNDLDSRAQAAASGGSGFIAKPTLPCEITLVSVSLLLRTRLAEAAQAIAQPDQPDASRVLPRAAHRREAPQATLSTELALKA